MMDANLSSNHYASVRAHSGKIYPSYKAVLKAKSSCFPENISVLETYAEINLQSVIDHTVQRICLVQEEVFFSKPYFVNNEIQMIIKWGCDGSEQHKYKQKHSTENEYDESLFCISMVPIQMFTIVNKEKIIIWQNLSPTSTRYCRPIKFMFAKETRQLILDEANKVEEQILDLSPTIYQSDNLRVEVKPKLVLCMIDGKICNSLSNYKSTQTCYICGANPTDMNKKTKISKRGIDKNMLAFGLSPLHSWIRFMECLLHIAYRLEIKVWRVIGEENKKKVHERKLNIQDRLKKEMGILVDMPKQQTGNTNDGNTARRFFRNSEQTADITGVDINIIKRFHTILACIASGLEINCESFEKFTSDTLDLYLSKYGWYYIPVSVHKILCHGKDVIEFGILPIGQLSEEAQESRNKDVRNYREHFTRKTSRIDTNTDLLHRLLISSDPFINSLRKIPQRKRLNLPKEVISMLTEPKLIEESSDSE